MKTIPLTRGFVANVDDVDFDWLNQYKWHVNTNNRKTHFYAVARIGTVMKKMHRLILGVEDSEVFVDHRDLNTLNNQRDNLRLATRSQNAANRKIRARAGVSYTGVYLNGFNPDGSFRWIAKCKKNGKAHIETYDSEIKAALGYNEMASRLHGEFAKLNII